MQSLRCGCSFRSLITVTSQVEPLASLVNMRGSERSGRLRSPSFSFRNYVISRVAGRIAHGAAANRGNAQIAALFATRDSADLKSIRRRAPHPPPLPPRPSSPLDKLKGKSSKKSKRGKRGKRGKKGKKESCVTLRNPKNLLGHYVRRAAEVPCSR
jgi:hypothetical protein